MQHMFYSVRLCVYWTYILTYNQPFLIHYALRIKSFEFCRIMTHNKHNHKKKYERRESILKFVHTEHCLRNSATRIHWCKSDVHKLVLFVVSCLGFTRFKNKVCVLHPYNTSSIYAFLFTKFILCGYSALKISK